MERLRTLLPPTAATMSDSQVSAWLRSTGLSRFSARFGAAGITEPDQFLELSPSDMEVLGVESPADRKRLTNVIAEQRKLRKMPPLPHMLPSQSFTTTTSENRDPASGYERPGRGIQEHGYGDAEYSHVAPPIQRQGTAFAAHEESRTVLPTVRVCVRKRPLSRRDNMAGERDVISTEGIDTLHVHEVKSRLDLSKYVDSHEFVFDHVFGDFTSNSDVYENTARPLVDMLFSGGRGTCFAYGQTGTGKTYTMEGTPSDPGLYILAVTDLFTRIRAYNDMYVAISFFEIYGSRLHDLLNDRAKVESREDSSCEVRIVGLTEKRCTIAEEVTDLIHLAARARSTGVTGANDDSSRSHAVFQIEVRREGVHGAPPTEVGRLSFVDLAGSERGSDTSSSTKQTRLEGAEINKSLLALKECIRAMDQRKDHTPFRGSKLTQVLKASLTGKMNCRTVMIANVSPASHNVEHTLNTLRYSQRVREMKASGYDRQAQASAYGIPTPTASRLRGGASSSSSRSLHTTPTVTPLRSPDSVSAELEAMPQASLYGKVPRPTSDGGTKPSDRRLSAASRTTPSNISTAFGAAAPIADAERLARDDPPPVRSGRRRVPQSRSMIPAPRGPSARRPVVLPKDDMSLPQPRDPTGAPTASVPRTRSRSQSISPLDSVAPRAHEPAPASTESRQVDYERVLKRDSDPTLRPHYVADPQPFPRQKSAPVGAHARPPTQASAAANAANTLREIDVDPRTAHDGLYNGAETRSLREEVAYDLIADPSDDEELLYAYPSAGDKPRRLTSSRQQRRVRSAQDENDQVDRFGGSAELDSVIALHKEQADALMSLMREGVELMRATEDGRLSPGAYATKLELNLAHSMDVLHTLKSRAAALGAAERHRPG